MTPVLTRPREATAPAPRAANARQTVALLGPQTRKATLARTLKEIGVTGQVAVGIVDGFKVINIDKYKRKGFVVA